MFCIYCFCIFCTSNNNKYIHNDNNYINNNSSDKLINYLTEDAYTFLQPIIS